MLMRRVLPWALVSLVAVAGLLGALVGVANQPSPPASQLRVSEVIAATRAAGTARFSYSSVAASRNPLLRSASFGEGSVDFTDDSVTTVEQSTSKSISQNGNAPSRQVTQTMFNNQIWVDHTFYTQLDVGGKHLAIGWIKAKLPTGSSGLLGMLDEVDPIGFLDGELGIRGTKIELIGSEMLDGMATTKYRVVVPTCGTASTTGSPQNVLGAIDLWLDSEGRLVQVRDVLHSTDPVKSFAGGSTTISTARLFDFGAPVTISAPKAVLPPGQGGVAFLSISPKGCPT
jgi:hypothetical protein